MPEEVSQEPQVHQIIGNLNAPGASTIEPSIVERNSVVKEVRWSDIQKSITKNVSELKKNYPDIEIEKIEAVADVIFGPLRLERFDAGHNKEQDELMARLSHNLVHGMIYASSPQSSDTFVKTIYNMVSVCDKIASTQIGADRGFSRYWKGIVAEYSLMKDFMKRGYRVYVPDYLQDSMEVAEEENEVLQFVKEKVDFIATNQEDTFIVDCRQPSQDLPTNDLVANRQYVNYKPKPGTLMENVFGHLFENTNSRKFEISIPTSRNAIVPLQRAESMTPENMRASLDNYGSRKIEPDRLFNELENRL